MRRSSAPSMKGFSKPESVGPRKPGSLQVPIDNADQTVVDLLLSAENHAHVLKNLAAVRKPKTADSSVGSAEPTVVSSVANSKTRFNVVWGKISTKKHKTWERDGTLELCGRSATLRDEEGKVIANSTGIKVDTVEEGSRLIVGSKEVEVIEKILSNDRTEKMNSEQTVPAKRPKLNTFKPPKPREVPGETSFSGKSFKHVGATEEIPSDFVPLVMQPPSYEHQWKYNQKQAPVSDVTVPYSLAKHLRSHQREGISFLYECILGFRLTDSERFGAILADEMGLGKTLQCISLIYTLMKQGPYGQPILKRVLIVTPSSLVENWDKEISKWLTTERIFTFIVGPNNKLRKYVQSPHIPILIISYELLSKQIEELDSVKFDLIVCDEGHRLKNSDIKVSSILDGIECPRKIILTGTPIQNDLQEFYSLINFVNPGLLGTYAEFKSKYENPIIQSQQPGVLPQFRDLGMSRLEELNTITSSFILRRTQEVINKYLPDKQEVVVFAHPSKLQTDLLHAALLFYDQSGPSAVSPLQLITILKKICNHPSLISTTEKSDNESLTKLLNDKLPPWQNMGPTDSGKLGVLDSLLENLIERQEKVVIVSYYSKTLDMIMGLCEHYNYKFCRLDGSTPSHDRCKIVSSFNNPSSDTFIFLLSAKAGGIGLNLIGASRLVLYDNDWNPASDLQAMSRIWRDGQTQKVFIYRLITAFSIEEKIYQRQISKTSLSGTVVDQKQKLSNLKFSNEELKDLFSLVEEGDDCLTHQMLNCDCQGIGHVPEPTSNSSQEDNVQASPERSRFQIRFTKTKPKKPKYSLKMQELMRWEHYRAPVDKNVLQELSLAACSDNIIFIFRNKVNQFEQQLPPS
ncbi:DNA repair and recombination protein RAD54B-like [Ochlerotatus camptorhynchus]|uniref:DNA repair and recombination protein RAD54B-like n=1 Tax=Ochlerotatus camptorhynchus TaxID=644619 RepID=UPI0031E2F4FD